MAKLSKQNMKKIFGSEERKFIGSAPGMLTWVWLKSMLAFNLLPAPHKKIAA